MANVNKFYNRGQSCWVDLCKLKGFDIVFWVLMPRNES